MAPTDDDGAPMVSLGQKSDDTHGSAPVQSRANVPKPSAPSLISAQNASLGSGGRSQSAAQRSQAKMNIGAGGMVTHGSRAMLGIREEATDDQARKAASTLTDQDVQDEAEIGDEMNRECIWEHKLVEEPAIKGGLVDFSGLVNSKDGQRFNWSIQNGLSDADASKALAEFGENKLTPKEKLPEWLKFLLHLVGGFSLLLWGGAILCFVVYVINGLADNLYLGIVLSVVVTATGIFSYMQEAKADAQMDSFASMAPEQVYCRRNGQTWEDLTEKMDAAALVPGDLVKVQLGEKIPADLIMVEVSDFKVNNSSLTGEPEPLERLNYCTDDDVMETKNVAFFGTFCEQGNCVGLVIRTGDSTRMGQIAKETSKDDGQETLMQMEIRHFIHIVSFCAGFIGIIFFIIAVPTYGIVDAVVFMIGIIVANVPEGLLATVTVALTLTARTMFQHMVLVKNMETVETLGSVTTIASDKTGTLTQNRMSANHAVYDFKLKAVDAVLAAGEKSHIAFKNSDLSFDALQRCAALCGSAKFATANEKFMNPNVWDSRTGNGEQGADAQEKDYRSHFHYVPHDLTTGDALSWKEIKSRSELKSEDAKVNLQCQSGEEMRWRDPDMSFRPYKDGNATDAGLMKFGESRVIEQYNDLAAAYAQDDAQKAKALLELGASDGGSYVVKYRKNWPMIAQIPFNSADKFMVTVHSVPQTKDDPLGERQRLLSAGGFDPEDPDDFTVFMMKGAAERVAGKCCTGLLDGKMVPPRVYFSMQSGKLNTSDNLIKDRENPMKVEDTTNAGMVLSRRKAFNIQTGVDEKEIYNGALSCEEWASTIKPVDDSIASLVRTSADADDSMKALMGDITSNTLKHHQSSLAVEGERVLGFAQMVARTKDLKDAGVLREDQGGYELTYENEATIEALGFNKEHQGAKFAWTYLGMISLVDPPREAVPAAVESCREASIQVVMVTGDHPLTAKSIATRIKIIQGDTWREFERENRIQAGEDPDLITEAEMFDSFRHHEWFGLRSRFPKVKGLAIFGPTIGDFKDDDWRYSLRMKELVFARTQPEQKKEIVGRMKELHELTFDAIDQLVACKCLLEHPGKLMKVHDELVEKFAEVDEEVNKKMAKIHEHRGNKKAKEIEAEIEEVAEEGRQDKKKRAEKYLELKDHEFRITTYLMLPIRAKEMNVKLNGQEADPVRNTPGVEPQFSSAKDLIDEIDKIYKKEIERNNQPKVVAVTGDGVNDSPALKAADCGIAMGIAGAEVAKENADMILMDDNFASIVKGIEQGRLIFDNLKKSIAYTLTSNIPEITPFLALIIFQIPIPLETVMILCIDLGTDMLPAISLAYEEAEGGIMKRAPRDKSKDRLVNSKLIGIAYGQIGMIQAASGFACYFLVFNNYGLSFDDLQGVGFDYVDSDKASVAALNYDTRMEILRKAQTSFLVSIVVAQWADVIICKTRERTIFEQGMKNMILNIGLLEETVLAIALVYCPPFQDAFKTTDIDFKMWCYGAPFAFLIWVYDEARKYLIRKERAGNDNWPEGKGVVERWTYY